MKNKVELGIKIAMLIGLFVGLALIFCAVALLEGGAEFKTVISTAIIGLSLALPYLFAER